METGASGGVKLREITLPPLESYTVADVAYFFEPALIRLPASVGEWRIYTEADGAYQDEDEEVTIQAEVRATLTMEEGRPEDLPGVQCMAGAICYRAEVATDGELVEEVTDERGRTHQVELDPPDCHSWIIPADDALERIWKYYGVNLGSLSALQRIAPGPGFVRGYWRPYQDARRIVVRAFGDSSIPRRLGSIGDLPDDVATRTYIELADLLPLLGILELIAAGDMKMALPSPLCAIEVERNTERASVVYFDGGRVEGSPPVPFQTERREKATGEKLKRLIRLSGEIQQEQRRILELKDWARVAEAVAEMGDDPSKALKQHTQQLRAQAEELAQAHRNLERISDDAIATYIELTQWAAKHKETALQKLRYRETLATEVAQHQEVLAERSSIFVGLPNNMDGIPAHFAAIPSGLAEGLELTSDPLGQAILRVKRESMALKGQKEREHLPMSLPLAGLKEADKQALIQQAEMLLGKDAPRWLIPQGMVAVSKLYRQSGGYEVAESSRRIYLNDWIDTMRPMQVERFKAKGRGEAFGKGRTPRDLFYALLGILHRLTYEKEGPDVKGWAALKGFYLTLGYGEDGSGAWADVMLNPTLHKFITGEGGLPYMLTNTQAMFSYDRAALDYTPAAQWAIEQLARINLYDRDTATLSTPAGDGITRLVLAHRLGLQPGPNERPAHILKRMNTILENLGNAGVIAGWKPDGRDKEGADAFGVKLHIEMHDDYRKAYNLTRKENQLKHAEKELQRPFSPPKKQHKALKGDSEEQAPKRRGRKPKASSDKG